MEKQNPRLVTLIEELRSRSEEEDVGVWREIASRLESPSRNHAEVNVSKIERYADEDEPVVVPGKVLGGGVVSKSVKVAAFDFSSSARDKIERADGEAVRLEEFIDENPDGSGVRVIR
ncbi:MAG: 50S ribosomal protein L18e [Halobacteria archaeon]|nr:50S ribosomal protein L18e [Halobacteria archaeon]